MGKHSSNGITYFNIDCVQEDNLNYLEAKHGISGYGVLVKLWRKIYMVDGYYCDWSEKNIFLFSREIGVPVADINAIVTTCFAEGIFDQEKYNNYGVLTGSGVQKRWLKIVTEARRKNCKIEEKFMLLPKTPEELPKTPEELPKTPTAGPQSKVKESKVKEKKVNQPTPATDKPPLPKTFFKKKKEEEPPEPYWQSLVAVWFAFGKEKFNEEPVFVRDDPKIFKRIIHLLKARASKKNQPWDETAAPKRLRAFLDTAFQEKWLSQNFLLSNLENQFNKITQGHAEATVDQKKKSATSILHTFEDKLKYLFDRFCEGDLTHQVIDPEIYDKLITRNYIRSGALESVPGETLDEKKRAGVIDFFKARRQKQQEVPA